MKKIILVIFLNLLFLPILVLAGGTNCPTEGLVPCGNVPSCPCELCDIFVMIDRVLDFLLFKIVPVLAALMIAIGGFMYIFAFGKPETISQAKRLFTAITIGLLIIYGAWALINTFFVIIGLSDFGLRLTGPDKWFIINCQ
ncbi:MAG: hypothetical protein COT32_02025 [Candidatus Nealsonbacteria bacterium CG08_land_8_20_14_0_20_36_22]|uniref:Uncharacterized protein n=1 Tax=Candidatus Nealsonbacteria bacterium CG08_land_8_20_14_0_20_36_22 TaxID=1974704 RepID=A0A2H0YNC4_9BACT|nr:MAG: hypothetical protein COT32_02025 [Candidatus Nealsonbacteria bacterium CG08_land_8_20_14_0_20_36_22]